jgi:hypothetical protein
VDKTWVLLTTAPKPSNRPTLADSDMRSRNPL